MLHAVSLNFLLQMFVLAASSDNSFHFLVQYTVEVDCMHKFFSEFFWVYSTVFTSQYSHIVYG